nr:hypothetical protein [Tanacetum cinerariifolium]
KQVGSDTTMPPPTAKGKRIKTSAKAVKPTKKNIPGVPDVPTYESDDEQISWKSSEEDNDDEVKLSEEDDDVDNQSNDDEDDDSQEDDNQDDNEEQTDSDNDDDDFVHLKFSTHDDEDKEEESFDPRVQTPSHVETTDDEDNDEDSHGVNVEEDELDEEEVNEEDEANELYRDVNINRYLDNRMNEVVKVVVQLQSDRLRDEAQAENEDFLNKLDENIKKIIKDQVKEQVKAQVSKILPKIEKTMNEQLKSKVLTRSSNESKTSHVIAVNLSELDLKKILIDKMERNKSIYRSADEDEEPSVGSNQGSKRRRAGKEPESTSAPKEKTSMSTRKSTEGSRSHHKSASKSAPAEEPMHTIKDLEEPTH